MPLNVNGTNIEKVVVNGTNVEKVVCNGSIVWEDKREYRFRFDLYCRNDGVTILGTQIAIGFVDIKWIDFPDKDGIEVKIVLKGGYDTTVILTGKTPSVKDSINYFYETSASPSYIYPVNQHVYFNGKHLTTASTNVNASEVGKSVYLPTELSTPKI